MAVVRPGASDVEARGSALPLCVCLRWCSPGGSSSTVWVVCGGLPKAGMVRTCGSGVVVFGGLGGWCVVVCVVAVAGTALHDQCS